MKRKLLYLLAGLLYVVIPLDLIPDMLPPLLSRLDDLLVVAYLFWRYRKMHQGPEGFSKEEKGSAERKESHRAEREFSEQKNDRTPYEVLEIPPTASEEEIRRAYRTLVSQYHPDKVDHLAPEFQKLAHQRMIEIQEAYSALTGNKT